MDPKTPASYALILLVVVDLALLVTRVTFLIDHAVPDPTITTSLQGSLTATVAALVFVVHRNGSVR